MQQRSLRVVETNKTFFSKITNTLTKILIPTKIGFNSIIITLKRNALIKYYEAYKSIDNNTKEYEETAKKYEDAYSLYLEAIDKNIMDSVYKKVKNNTATNFEREALSKYYLIVSLKEKNYLEYKYKKQEYLLKIDYETYSMSKKENHVKRYKAFYVSKMDSLYKGLLKNYSVQLADSVKQTKSRYDETYKKIFEILENYVADILPIKVELDAENTKLAEESDKYENIIIGKQDSRNILKKKMVLLGISRQLFTHSLPLNATEKCYIKLIKEVRELIVKAKTELKREPVINLFVEVVEDFNIKILSTKVYWDKPEERIEYKKFWDKYQKSLEKNSAADKKIIVIKQDLKEVYKNEKKYKDIISIYKEILLNAGAMRNLKTTYTTKSDKFKEVKKNEVVPN